MTAATVEALHLVVHGGPKTKGSMRHIGNGRMIEDHKSSKPWREAVKWAAIEAIAAREGTGDPFAMLTGPVHVTAVFFFDKPKSAPRTRRIWPITRTSGDVDKLLRNVFDALVDAAVMHDDSQVVRVHTEKAFAGDEPGYLPSPGLVLYVCTLPAALTAGGTSCSRPTR